jgi:hypothetical protein
MSMTVRGDLPGITVATGIVAGSTVADGTVNGTGIDLQDYEPGSRIMLVAGIGTRTDGTFTYTLEQSDDNSTFTAVTALAGTMTAISASNTRRTATYVPTKRYIRAVKVAASVTSGSTGTFALLLIVAPGMV